MLGVGESKLRGSHFSFIYSSIQIDVPYSGANGCSSFSGEDELLKTLKVAAIHLKNIFF